MTNVPKAVEHQIAGGTLKDMVRELTAENERLQQEITRLTAALVECQEAKALKTAKPDTCDRCDQPAYQYWIDGTRFCREHQINRDSLEMERGE